MHGLKYAVVRPESKVRRSDLDDLKTYLDMHFVDVVMCIPDGYDHRKWRSTDERLEEGDCLVVVLDDNEFGKCSSQLDMDIWDDVDVAYNQDMPIFIAYRALTTGAWRIYEIDQPSLQHDGNLTGLSGTTRYVLERCARNIGRPWSETKKKIEYVPGGTTSYFYEDLKKNPELKDRFKHEKIKSVPAYKHGHYETNENLDVRVLLLSR